MSTAWRLRAAVLTLGGALAVHQGRYVLAPREHHHELAAVHEYLGWLMPAVAALIFLAAVQFAVSMRRADARGAPRLPSARVLWLASTAALVGVFGVQETIELTAIHGHVPAIGELLAHGGWQVAALGAAVGGALALLLKGAAAAIGRIARGRHAVRRRPGSLVARVGAVIAPHASVIARKLAGRAPPSLA